MQIIVEYMRDAVYANLIKPGIHELETKCFEFL